MSKCNETVEWRGKCVEVNFYFEAGYSARLSGPPEDCYEGMDDEYEIESVLYEDVDITFALDEDNFNEIVEKLEDLREWQANDIY